ncbi:diacylglycerol/lipid kinase family protein [Gryllotalpicola ginsengisoli]|uniref:diacylglycerol/lipid kinase family protein n=1 Tax=Gryllotalpicola ginsengisoli TaxID=444608 RepID=UPI0003B5A824|nr:diacylglycerol kinase family protein [Gryllotalpicola ginsengisoli]
MSHPVPEQALTGAVAVVANPVKRDIDRVRESVVRRAHFAGLGDPLWFETTLDDIGAGVARSAVESGASLVIVAGGDGTVRAAAGALRGTGVALGVVPSGTGNLLARNLRVPIGDPEAAVAVAFTGRTRAVDVGLAELEREGGEREEHPFMVVAGAGIDAAMIANTSPALKERLGWLAYVDGALRSVARSQPVRAKVRVDGPGDETMTHGFDVHTVLVGNVGALPGDVELLPGARIDDGVLDVAVMHPKSVFGWALIGRSIVWENHVLRRSALGRKLISFRSRHSPHVLSYMRGPVVTARFERPVEAELDGDEVGPVQAARFRTDPQSLLVRVPA